MKRFLGIAFALLLAALPARADFQLGQYLGFWVGGCTLGTVALSFEGTGSSTANTANPSFAGEPIGAEAADRYIVVTAGGRNAGGTPATLNGGTIGGIAATVISAPSLTSSGMMIANVPTGTTATIVVNWSATQNAAAIGVYGLVGIADPNPVTSGGDLQVDTAAAFAVTVNIPPNGAAVGLAHEHNSSSSWTWGGLAEDYDIVPGGEGGASSGASSSTPGSTDVTAAVAAGGGDALIAASWAPVCE